VRAHFSRFVNRRGFTLLELMTVIVIISILTVILIPVVQGVTNRARRAACTTNLQSLKAAATAYMQQHMHWPQVDPLLISRDAPGYADAWYEKFQPFGLTRKNWICPSMQAAMNSPDFETKRENYRVDYIATPFDDVRQTPFRWANQPWFIEKADMHGTGNLMIFLDGSVKDLSQMAK
jgi:prepilin-type N-terminal cleavage/methylation domain-containing protein